MSRIFIRIALVFVAVHHFCFKCTSEFVENDRKIAFLFLVRGHMPLEDIWREFFSWQANSSHYSIYVHPHQGFRYHNTSFFHGKEIEQSHNVKWGGMSQVRAIKDLVREALKDPLNDWFCLMSEACIPLHPFPIWREALQKQEKSMVNACAMDPGEMETETRWRSSLDQVGMVKSQWRKSATWFSLNRKHSYIFVNETALEKGWEPVPCCDEHYLPSILAYHNLDNETTCSDGFAHVKWDSLSDSHPHSYRSEEITEDLFSKFRNPVGSGAGFSQLCSGNNMLCHFTARKFTQPTKLTLLENLEFILSDKIAGIRFSNDQWYHFQDRVRVRNMTEFYLIENHQLRAIPDIPTLHLMHLNASWATPLTEIDMENFPFGPLYPSRRDGQILKAPKNTEIFLVQNGKRRGFPDMDTMAFMGFALKDVSIVSEGDLDQIPKGIPLPVIKRRRLLR